MAALAAVAIQNARLYGDVEHLAITDGLTGLYNHRYFYDRLAQEVARAQRYDLPLSLLMIDIDDFRPTTIAPVTAPATPCCASSAWCSGHRRASRSTWSPATAAKSSP